MNLPLVTVCITTFNRYSYIERAIKGVLQQTYSNIEIIVVDDHSSDSTENVCNNLLLKDGLDFTYYRHKENKGLAGARNTAINRAKGKYFTFIDDDDKWENSFVEEFVKLASRYDSSWCFCCGLKNENKSSISEIIPDFDGPLEFYFKKGFTPPVASQFYNTETLLKYKGYDENIKSGVDHDLWLTLSVNGIKIKSLKKALAIPNNDNTIERMTNNEEKRIKGITNSLNIWRPTIVSFFGEDFYARFSKAYILREKKGFRFKIMASQGLIAGFDYIRKNPEVFNFKEIIKDCLKYSILKLPNLKILLKSGGDKVIPYPPIIKID